jgi:tetratricopeptide (TPR) repeat protein
MRLFRIEIMTLANSSIHRLARGSIPFLSVLSLFCATYCGAQEDPQGATRNSEVLSPAVKSLIVAQQDAIQSGDADRILASSSSVAVASLALLNNLDAEDQESRKAIGALPYAEGLLSDLPTETMLLKMELSLGETAPAAELKKRILSTNPESVKLHLSLAEIFGKSSQFDEAVGEAQRADELDRSSRDAEIALGLSYWGLNVFQYNEETLNAFTAAQKLDPQDFTANLFLGSIESQYQLFDAASQHLHAAIAANPSAAAPWYQLGMNAYQQSQLAEAGELLAHYISLEQDEGKQSPSQMWLALVTLDQIAEEQGHTSDSANRTEEAALKQQLVQSGGAGDARESTDTVAMGSSAPSALAPAPEKVNRPGASAETIAELRELAANALGDMGTVMARKKDFDAAVVPLRYAVDEDPTLEPATRNLGLADCISGIYDECAQVLKLEVAGHPDDSVARGYLGDAQLETGEYSEAALTFASLGSVLSSQPLFEAMAAEAFARAGQRDRAVQALVDLRNAGQSPQLQALEAIAYLDMGDTDQAIGLAKAALSGSEPYPAEAQRVMGLLALQRGNASEAVTEFQNESRAEHQGQVVQLETQALLADALIEGGKGQEGRELSLKLSRTNPSLANMYFNQGQTLLKSGDPQAAYEKFAAALALAPNDNATRRAFDSVRRALKPTSK